MSAAPAAVKTHEVFMPALSSTMTEGKIVQWLKSVGDRIEVGDAVMVVESDKADMEVESFEAGFLAALLVEEGGSIGVGATVALIAETEADIPAVQAMGLSGNIPSGDGSRHDGTTAVDIEKIGMDNPSHAHSTAEAAVAAPMVPAGVEYSEVFMPALSSTMTEGKIVQWLKGVGDKVNVGESVMVVESDKADMDVESFDEGYIAKILVPEGGTNLVGAACAILVANEADIGKVGSAPAASAAPVAAAAAPVAAAAAPAKSAAPTKPNVVIGEVFMPALSSTMTEGKVVQWIKSKGDKVSVGDAVLVVESDKADMDVESFDDGFLAAVLTGEGEAAPVGSPIALLAPTEADIPAVAAYGEALKASMSGGGAAAPSSPVTESAAPVAAAAAPARPAGGAVLAPGGRVLASGYAKKLATAYGVDLASVPGSGPNNRIVAADIEAAKARGPSAPAAAAAPKAAGGAAAPAAPAWVPAPGVIAATPRARALAKTKGLDLSKIAGTGNFGRVTEDDVKAALGQAPKKAAEAPVAAAAATREAPELPDGPKKMDGMQNAVAKNMEATLAIPVFRVSRKIRTDAFDDLYRQLKPRGVTVSAMLAKAVAMVLEKHPIMNAKYAPGQTVYQKDINIAMAVAIEGGLLTPTLRNANLHGLLPLSQTWKGLVAKAKDRKLTPQDNSAGTFVVTNLGMYGVSEFAAILPPNTGSILAIGGSLPVVAARADGSFGVVKEMTVTITCDHRHIYGADAAEFLKDLADLMENNLAQLLL